MGIKGHLFKIIYTLIAILGSNYFANASPTASSISTNSTEDSLYYDVFLQYRVQSIDSALKYAKLSYKQSLELNDIELSIKSLNAMGYCYHKESKFDSALYAYRLGVEQAKISENLKREMWLHNSIGIVYDDIGKYDSAIANYYTSLKIARSIESEFDVSVALSNIGNINLDLGNVESAIGFYLQSAEIKERNSFNGLEITYYNIGLGYNQLEDLQNGIKYFNKVLEICESGDCRDNYIQKGQLGLGMCYFGLEDYKKSRNYITRVKDSEDILTQILAYRYMSELSSIDLEHELSLSYIDKSINLANSINGRESLKNNYLRKGEIFEDMGRTDSALIYFQYHYALKDDLFNETVASSIQDLFVGFEREQADAEIMVKEREITARKRINFLLAMVIILSISIIVKAIMDLSKRKRMNKYLDKQVALKTSELTETNRHLSEKSKDLDNLIYNISHEIRGPLARLLGLINIGKLETTDNAGAIKYYDELENEAKDLEKILKRMIIINNVNHHLVNKTKITPDKFFNNLLDNTRYIWEDKIEVGLDLDGIQEIETDVELLEIALQNMIENSVKFRRTNQDGKPHLEIKLAKGEKGRIDITMSDNGIGFDDKFRESVMDLFFVASEKGGTGMGLHHTKLALDKIGASFEVLSSRDPTTFVAHL